MIHTAVHTVQFEQGCSSKYSELSCSLLSDVQLGVALAFTFQKTLDFGLKWSIGKKHEFVLDNELKRAYTWCQHVCRFLQNADIHLFISHLSVIELIASVFTYSYPKALVKRESATNGCAPDGSPRNLVGLISLHYLFLWAGRNCSAFAGEEKNWKL